MKSICLLSIGDKAVTSELDRAGYKKMGVQVLSADTFSKADEMARNNEVDVISINIDCTDFDALQTCRYFKDNPKTSKIPIVGASVRTSAKVRNDALAHGVDMFVEQPIPRSYFIEKIKNLLDQQTRSDDRVSFIGMAEFLHGAQPIQVDVIDISPTGILVGLNIELNTFVEFNLNLPGYKRPTKLKGQVVRKIEANESGPQRVAIQFTNLDAKFKKRLEDYVRRNKHDGELRYYL